MIGSNRKRGGSSLPGWLLIVVATAGCGPGTTASFDQGGPGVDTEGLKGKGGGKGGGHGGSGGGQGGGSAGDWVARFDDAFNRDDTATAITVDSDGNSYVTGESCALVDDFGNCYVTQWGTFTNPTDIGSLVASLTGFNVTPDNVPTTGLDSSEVKETVTELAVAFFGDVFSETETKGGQK